ncbi:MAG TPA: TetR/AcrR family transcriptional regulator [Polyangiales bacterium]|nr:TetR/AcrR family transcriptional regulator [Polyangiales bacterium]
MRSNTQRQSNSRRARVDPEELRARILATFSTKAKRLGIRALLMTELAAELRISATTLYKLYPSKEALALACVDRWADELGAAESAKVDRTEPTSGFDAYLRWIDAWADANASLSPAFARDLKSDYPAVWKRYREVVHERKRRGARLLRPLLKPDVDERVAFALLDTIFATVLQPEFADRLHISRREALRTAVSIWAAGALARPAKTRPIATSKR